MALQVLGIATCYNRKQKTVSAIEGLIAGNPSLEFSFVITDDHSTDGTKAALQNITGVTVLDGDGSLFYSGGMRKAIDWAQKQTKQYDFCLLFNDDVEFFEKSIEELTQKKENIVWIGPTCDEKGAFSYGGAKKASRWRPAVNYGMAKSPEGIVCDTFCANCVLIPWKIFKNMDNIDTVYTHLMGDFDIGFGLVRSGVDVRSSDRFVGKCCKNSTDGTWQDTSLGRIRRIQLKESPKGLPVKEWFHYLKKEYNLFTAIVYSVTPYLRIILKK